MSFLIKLFLEIVVYIFVYMANTPGEWVFYPPKREIKSYILVPSITVCYLWFMINDWVFDFFFF